MRKLFTLAYPTLSADDSLFIDQFRRLHDGQHRLVEAHYTLLFGASGFDQAAYVDHVRDVAQNMRPIPFLCKYAMLGADDGAERGYVYLVPDEGYSGLSRLHDALYRQMMAPLLLLDIPYVPHITIGSSADRVSIKMLCDELNDDAIEIRGSVDRVTVAALEGGTLQDIASFALG